MFEIIVGPEVCSDEIGDELESLLAAHPKVCVSRMEAHPRDAGFKLGDNMLFEEERDGSRPYRTAFVIERANRDVQNGFLSNFYNLKSGAKVMKGVLGNAESDKKRKFSLD